MFNSRLRNIVVLTILALAILAPRVFTLGRFLTADEKRWQANVNGFVMKLARGDGAHLLQQPHPGITTQWLAAPAIYSDSWATRKLPLVLGQSILVAISGYFLWRLWGKWPAVIGTLALSLDPLFIAHTRIYAMDSLLAQFCLLSILTLLLWRHINEKRYLVFSGMAAAAALLSKLSGVILVPFVILIIIWWAYPKISEIIKNVSLWLTGYIIAAIAILPSFLFRPLGILGDFMELFRSDEYTAAHKGGEWYYAGTLWFFSTPLHFLAVIAAVILLIYFIFYGKNRQLRDQFLIFLAFIALFTILITIGAKKGDRYILPVFTIFDTLAAAGVAGVATLRLSTRTVLMATYILSALLLWQAVDIYRIHPYTLAYANPLTKAFLGNRRLGWGEGLDLAAEYINSKPQADSIKVASYYPVEFSYRFRGEAVPVHQWENDKVDYVVLYRAMLQRGSDAWETDVWQHFQTQTPEKVFKLNGIDYVWVYKK